MKEEVEELKRENPRFNSMTDRIIQEIEKYQTASTEVISKDFMKVKSLK